MALIFTLAGRLTLAYREIDFERVDSYDITITVGDVKSTVNQTFTVTIINENEAPWFHEHFYTLETEEGTVGGERKHVLLV